MSDSRAHVYAQPVTPELNESDWLAWKARNRVKDRIRAAKRKRVALLIAVAGVTGLVLFLM